MEVRLLRSPLVVAGADMRTRNFLLFIPANIPNLRAVLSYYTATANVNAEGDVHINDTLQGFGKLFSFLFRSFVSSLAHPLSATPRGFVGNMQRKVSLAVKPADMNATREFRTTRIFDMTWATCGAS